MTEQRPEDNNQTPTDEPGGVWVDNSASGLTDEPGVWVDPPGIDPDRLGAMIREQDSVTDYVGDVQEEPNLGGVPQPGSAEQQIHSLDLSSAYEGVSPEYKHAAEATKFGESYDKVVAEAKETSDTDGFDPVFGSILGGGPIGTKIGEEIGEEQDSATEAKLNHGVQDITSDGLDLSSAYEEATPPNPTFDSAYDQIFPGAPTDPIDSAYYEFEAPVGSPDFEKPDDFDPPLPNIINVIPEEEPPYEFEAPVGSPDFEKPDDFESPYGESQEHPGANIPDLVEQPGPPGPPLQFDSYSTETSYLTTGLSSATDDAYLTDPSLMEDPTTVDQNDQDQDFGGGF